MHDFDIPSVIPESFSRRKFAFSSSFLVSLLCCCDYASMVIFGVLSCVLLYAMRGLYVSSLPCLAITASILLHHLRLRHSTFSSSKTNRNHSSKTCAYVIIAVDAGADFFGFLSALLP